MMAIDAHLKQARAALDAARGELVEALKTERGRRRGALVRSLHEVNRQRDPGYRYTSQAGQDLVVDRVFEGKRGGTFVDIGGYDGVTGSNTLFLEVFRGWTGVLVEPVSAQLEAAQAVRRCQCLGVGVGPEAGRADFIEVTSGYTQMSGLAATYDPATLANVRGDLRHTEVTREIDIRTLPEILDDTGLTAPDFISLDIEGGEVAVLEAFPFSDYRAGVWSIENNTGTGRIREIMTTAGYDLFELCGPDEMYRLRA